MRASTVQFVWREPRSTASFHSAVSLHGHTMHSQECLNFLPRYLHLAPVVSQIVSRYQRAPHNVDFARAWWTPPLSPASALSLEQKQIARLGLRPLVSLTDHDDIRAGLSLGVATDSPISVEWTVPYRSSIFHLGIHNLPPESAASWMQTLAAYTAAPEEGALPAILHELSRIPGLLIVLNHPFWIEEGVLEQDHPPALARILHECLAWLHAFELNGTRPWMENSKTMELARSHDRPVISGGDRHACEPNACINLTNARDFTEFAGQVREGHSTVLFMPQYREPLAQRMLAAGRDILAPYPEYPGRERWPDRIFYRGADGVARSLTQVCSGRIPRLLAGAVSAVQFFGGARFRPALRLFFQPGAEQSL
jgi:hypothetical protein